MVKEKEMTRGLRAAFARLAAVMLAALIALMLSAPVFTYAAKETEPEEPIREVHNVGVGNDAYCFFVTHNVVLTPAEVAGMTDEELTATILEKAGLYMKKANCKVASHKEISRDDWTKKHGSFLLGTDDIAGIRAAEPVDGSPVKFYMDLLISLTPEGADAGGDDAEGEDAETEEGEDEEEQEPLYSTFKRTSPRLLFAVVATEEDAKYGEDICKDDSKPEQGHMPSIGGGSDSGDDEMLPEYRTIQLADRSGAPIGDTLTDGTPVELEWIEPKHGGAENDASFFDRFPGGIAGFAAMTAAAAAAIAAIVIAAKRRKTED